MLPVDPFFCSPYRRSSQEEELEITAVGSLTELPKVKPHEALFSNVASNGGSRFRYRISATHACKLLIAKGFVPKTKDDSPGFVRYYSPSGGSVRMMVWVDHHIYDKTKEDDDFVEVFIFRGDVDPCTGEIKRYDMASCTFRGVNPHTKRSLQLCEQDQVPTHGLTVEIFA